MKNALKGAVDLSIGNRIPIVKNKLVIHKQPSDFVNVASIVNQSKNL